MSKTLSLKKIDTTGTAVIPVGTTFEMQTSGVNVGPLVSLAEALMPDSMQVVKPFTAAQLRAMLADLEPNGVTLDPTMNLPISPTDPAELAAKAALPPPEDRKAGAAPQLPPAAHGSFSLNGIPIFAPQVNLGENINPSTGLPYVQVTASQRGGLISPPPSRNFR